MTSTRKRTMLSLGWVAAATLLLGAASPGQATPLAFTIDGDATQPISPGITVSLDLELTNPYGRPLAVHDLSVRLTRVKAPNRDAAHPCSLRDFTIVQASSSLAVTVAANTALPLSRLGLEPASWPQVGMLNLPVNQDGCQGATLTLRYTASGSLET